MHGTERNSTKSSKTIRQPLPSKTKAVMKKILKLLLPPHFHPSPPSNVVYDEDMIEIVENDVGIIPTTLLEGGRGSNHKSQYIL